MARVWKVLQISGIDKSIGIYFTRRVWSAFGGWIEHWRWSSFYQSLGKTSLLRLLDLQKWRVAILLNGSEIEIQQTHQLRLVVHPIIYRLSEASTVMEDDPRWRWKAAWFTALGHPVRRFSALSKSPLSYTRIMQHSVTMIPLQNDKELEKQ